MKLIHTTWFCSSRWEVGSAKFGSTPEPNHKQNGKNLEFKFNLSFCFAFNQPLKAKKKILMNIISQLSPLCGHRVTYKIVLTWVKSKCCVKLWYSANVLINNLRMYHTGVEWPRWQNCLGCWYFLRLKALSVRGLLISLDHSPRMSHAIVKCRMKESVVMCEM